MKNMNKTTTQPTTSTLTAEEIKYERQNRHRWNALVTDCIELCDNSHRCGGSRLTRAEMESMLITVCDFFPRFVDQCGSTSNTLEVISDIMDINVPADVRSRQ